MHPWVVGGRREDWEGPGLGPEVGRHRSPAHCSPLSGVDDRTHCSRWGEIDKLQNNTAQNNTCMGEHSQDERDRSEENCDNLDAKGELAIEYFIGLLIEYFIGLLN